jgi:hypothetical protein
MSSVNFARGGPSLAVHHIPRRGAPSLRFLQEPAPELVEGWAAMRPAQFLSVL